MDDIAPTSGVAEARKQLTDPAPAVRNAAAEKLRQALAEGGAASRERGAARWKQRLSAIPLGISAEEFKTATGASAEGRTGSMGGSSMTFRLDDNWTVNAQFDRSDKLRELGPLTASVRPIWVEPPPGYSGRWVTYFANGVVAHDIQYQRGAYERFKAYYDSGQLVYEQRYVNGKIDGAEVGFHRNGAKAYEISHAAGKSVGRWVHWYPNGKMQSEQTYVNGALEGTSMNWREDGSKSTRMDCRAGKETGQAAWDEQGKLLFAHGSAERSPVRAPGSDDQA